jgi:hypothetical protein
MRPAIRSHERALELPGVRMDWPTLLGAYAGGVPERVTAVVS